MLTGAQARAALCRPAIAVVVTSRNSRRSPCLFFARVPDLNETCHRAFSTSCRNGSRVRRPWWRTRRCVGHIHGLVETVKIIYRAAAEKLIPVTLEQAGKSPMS